MARSRLVYHKEDFIIPSWLLQRKTLLKFNGCMFNSDCTLMKICLSSAPKFVDDCAAKLSYDICVISAGLKIDLCGSTFALFAGRNVSACSLIWTFSKFLLGFRRQMVKKQRNGALSYSILI